ncbi:hypothetical protein HDV63DRAFT_176332 [Trichoderma sp. SZMC 28014]
MGIHFYPLLAFLQGARYVIASSRPRLIPPRPKLAISSRLPQTAMLFVSSAPFSCFSISVSANCGDSFLPRFSTEMALRSSDTAPDDDTLTCHRDLGHHRVLAILHRPGHGMGCRSYWHEPCMSIP